MDRDEFDYLMLKDSEGVLLLAVKTKQHFFCQAVVGDDVGCSHPVEEFCSDDPGRRQDNGMSKEKYWTKL